jgi:hypothetical protein
MSGSTSQSMTLPIIAGVVVVGGLITVFFMRGNSGDDPGAGEASGGEEARATSHDRGATRGGGAGHADRPTAEAAPPSPTQGAIVVGGEAAPEEPAVDPGNPTPGVLPADPRFGPAITEMTAWVSEDGYGEAPTATLQSRFDRVIAGMQTGRQVSLAVVGCKAGGGDCRLVGTAPTPIDIRTFAEGVEQSTPEGDEQLPTVTIEETHSSSSGESRFKMGVYYP